MEGREGTRRHLLLRHVLDMLLDIDLNSNSDLWEQMIFAADLLEPAAAPTRLVPTADITKDVFCF
jgi:hypothetical protein